ncbi:MAG: D-alanyl-D-alanine carboxypeptidase, partial [Lachnospiraceae bacterium]
EWATGLKTGSTSKAKCCLSATAKKNNIELIAVVMAAPNSKTRFSDAITLLNYGYNTCSIYQDNEEKQLEPVNVVGGKQGFVPVKCESDFTYLFLENYDKNLITSEIVMEESLKAPFDANTKAGEIIYYYQGEEIGRVNILTQEGVEEEGIFDAFGKVFGNWLI